MTAAPVHCNVGLCANQIPFFWHLTVWWQTLPCFCTFISSIYIHFFDWFCAFSVFKAYYFEFSVLVLWHLSLVSVRFAFITFLCCLCLLSILETAAFEQSTLLTLFLLSFVLLNHVLNKIKTTDQTSSQSHDSIFYFARSTLQHFHSLHATLVLPLLMQTLQLKVGKKERMWQNMLYKNIIL